MRPTSTASSLLSGPTLIGFGAFAYLSLVLYGSLFPFNRIAPELFNPTVLISAWPAHISRSDVWVNILAYLPIGFLMARFLGLSGWAISLATLSGLLLSCGMEVIQTALPGRVPSLVDILANSGGALLGAVLAIAVSPRYGWAGALHDWRRGRVARGPIATSALVAVTFWGCSQLLVALPSMSVDNSILAVLSLPPIGTGLSDFSWTRFWYIVLEVIGLGMLLKLFLRQPFFRPVFIFFSGTLLLGAFIAGQSVGFERLTAVVTAFLALYYLSFTSSRKAFFIALLALIGSVLLRGLQPGYGTGAFIWVPLSSLENRIGDMANIMEGLWHGLAFGVLARWRLAGRQVAYAFAAFVVLSFGIEFVQPLIGRYGDITDVLVLLTGWGMAWFSHGPQTLYAGDTDSRAVA